MSTEGMIRVLQDGLAAARANNNTLARLLFREATEREPNNEIAWSHLAAVAESPAQSIPCLERVVHINPANKQARQSLVTALMQAGCTAFKCGDKTAARTHMLAVVEHDPACENAWLLLAGAAVSPAEAVSSLQHALALNPNSDRARAGLAWYGVAVASEIRQAAWTCPLCRAGADRPHEICPDCGGLLKLKSPLEFARHQPAKPQKIGVALDALRTNALEEEFDNFYAQTLALMNLQRFAEALTTVHKILALQPGNLDVRRFALALKQAVTVEESAGLARQTRQQARRKTVLVVDDSATVRKLVRGILEPRGFRVLETPDGNQVADVLRQAVPDLVLLDVTMSGLDGYQVCRILRQTRETAQVPIVMLTGKDGFFSKLRGRMAGASRYLTKPFDPETLAQTVESYLGAAQPPCPDTAGV